MRHQSCILTSYDNGNKSFRNLSFLLSNGLIWMKLLQKLYSENYMFSIAYSRFLIR